MAGRQGQRLRSAVSGLLLALLAACSSTPERHRAATPLPQIADRLQDTFTSGGRPVRIEKIPVPGSDPRPAVLMLHGASGVGGGWMLYPHGTAIAARGIRVFIVHYFDGLSGGDLAGTSRFAERDRVIRDAIAFVRAEPGVDPSRIGLFGLSLGGFHALSLAAADRRIAAVADVMGAMPRSVDRGAVRRMPPTLILHGARDGVVPLGRVVDLAQILDRAGAAYEMKLYLDQGHSFAGSAHADSIRTVADFFAMRLAGGTVAAR